MACTSTHHLPRPASVAGLQMTMMMKHDSGVVTPLMPPPSAPAAVVVAPVAWGSSLAANGELPLVELSQIPGFEVKRRFAGAVEGFLIGAAAGALTGAAIGSSFGSDGQCAGDGCAGISFSATDRAAIGAVVAGIPGAVLGALVGALRGHTDRYLF